MTVSTTANRVTTVADGVAVVFNFAFQTYDISHINVYQDGAVFATGFTVTLNADQVASPGGYVTFDVAPGNGVEVTLQRVVPDTQGMDLTPYGIFPSETVERAHDLSAMRDQQLQDQMSRSLLLPVNATASDLVLDNPVQDEVLAWENADPPTKLVSSGASATQLLAAETNAAASAAAASGSASAASTSASAAAASALAAEQSAIVMAIALGG